MREPSAPWDAFESRSYFEGRWLEPANDVPDSLILWVLDRKGWTWRQYVAWAKLHPRQCHHAPPL